MLTCLRFAKQNSGAVVDGVLSEAWDIVECLDGPPSRFVHCCLCLGCLTRAMPQDALRQYFWNQVQTTEIDIQRARVQKEARWWFERQVQEDNAHAHLRFDETCFGCHAMVESRV